MNQAGILLSEDLLSVMRRLHDDGETSEPLAIALSAWEARVPGEAIDGDDLSELGEVWRLASLAASRPGAFSTERLVWRARALSAFLRTANHNGAAMLMMPAYFDAVREGAPPSDVLAILESMRLIADDRGPIPKSEVLSSCYEKEGYYRTLDAEALPISDLAGRSAGFSAASRCYDLAFEAEPAERRRWKIRAAQASTSFLAATEVEQQDEAVATVRTIIAEIEESQTAAGAVVRIGLDNIKLMIQRRRDLLPYDIT